jgi:signal transduction histidine kinase
MINQLLDLSRIEAGKMEWRLEPLRLSDVVIHAVEANRSLFDDKGITLVVDASAGDQAVLADRDKIIQVLTNLLSNAAKFTPAQGRVHVRTYQEASQAVVEVEDTGVGIPPGQIGAVFEKFRQVGETLTAKPEGAGLGLPISREIVQAHGGSLTARSVLGRGSSFRMTLPVAA